MLVVSRRQCKVLLEGVAEPACWCCCRGDEGAARRVGNVPNSVLVKRAAARCC